MLGRQDQVAGERQLEAAADRHAVQRRDHRLVEVGQLLQPAEAADAVVAVGALAALGRGLEVPAGAEELLAAAGDDGDPQRRVVAEGGEGAAERAAGGAVDGVGLGPVEHDLQDAVGGGGPDCLAHAFAPRLQADQDVGRHGTLAGGADDQGVDVELDQPVGMGGGEARHRDARSDHGVEVAGAAGRGSPAAGGQPSGPAARSAPRPRSSAGAGANGRRAAPRARRPSRARGTGLPADRARCRRSARRRRRSP